MTRPQIEQHMRVEVCRWCGAEAKECGGKCVSATELAEIRQNHKPKVRSRDFVQWPEWKALAQRLGIGRCHTRIVLDVAVNSVVKLTVESLGLDHCPCPQPHDDTAPSGSGTPASQETTPTPATSVDTQQPGTEQP